LDQVSKEHGCFYVLLSRITRAPTTGVEPLRRQKPAVCSSPCGQWQLRYVAVCWPGPRGGALESLRSTRVSAAMRAPEGVVQSMELGCLPHKTRPMAFSD